MPHAGSRPKTIATSSGIAAEDAGARGDPQRLGGHDLLGVDRRGEDRVVRPLELALDERPEHRREHAREHHRGGDGPGADELDVVEPVDLATSVPEAEAEREQVDRRLDRRRERRRAPERREVDDLADEDAGERVAVEPPDARAPAVAGWRPSGHLLSGEQDEDVLEVRRAALALGAVAVEVLGAQDRHARAGAARRPAAGRARRPRPRAAARGGP